MICSGEGRSEVGECGSVTCMCMNMRMCVMVWW